MVGRRKLRSLNKGYRRKSNKPFSLAFMVVRTVHNFVLPNQIIIRLVMHISLKSRSCCKTEFVIGYKDGEISVNSAQYSSVRMVHTIACCQVP